MSGEFQICVVVNMIPHQLYCQWLCVCVLCENEAIFQSLNRSQLLMIYPARVS